MKCLIFANTPAHIHLYKHVVEELRARGHDVLVLGRDYGCTVELIEWYDLPHEVYGYCATAKGSLFARLPAHYARALYHVNRFDPDLIFGMGGYAAHTAALTRTPSVLVLDSESTGLDHAVSTPLARAVLTPDTFRKDLGENHHVFPGFKECAYLHPEVYESNSSIRERLGVDADEPYAIVRLNAFGSHHDVGEGGIDEADCRELIDSLAERATVFVSDEGRDVGRTVLLAPGATPRRARGGRAAGRRHADDGDRGRAAGDAGDPLELVRRRRRHGELPRTRRRGTHLQPRVVRRSSGTVRDAARRRRRGSGVGAASRRVPRREV